MTFKIQKRLQKTPKHVILAINIPCRVKEMRIERFVLSFRCCPSGKKMQQHVSSSRSFCKSKILLSPLLSVLQKYPFDKTRDKNKKPTCAHILTWQIGLLLWLKVAWVQASAKHQMESSRHITKHLPGVEKKKVKLFIEFHLFSSLSFKNLPYRNTQQTAFRSEIVKSGHSRLSIQK